jgi:hypothetical protein
LRLCLFIITGGKPKEGLKDDKKLIVRTCGYKQKEDPKPEACKEQKGKGSSVVTCVCEDEKCNGATKGIVAISGGVLTILGFLPFFLVSSGFK